MENPKTIRRIKIISVYLILFSMIAFIIYLIKAPAATCSDSKQNQGEKAVDCGGPCSPCRENLQTKDIVIQETAFAPGGNSTYDVAAKISNPNDSIGAREFKYTFILKDASGAIIASRDAADFILPSDTRYVAQLGIATENNAIPTSVDIVIGIGQWEKLQGISKPQIGVYSKKFGQSQLGNGNQAEGIMRNESSYDLKEINAIILLRDGKGNIVGISTTKKNSLRAKEEQYFRVTWPYLSGVDVQKMEVDPQVNVLK